MVYICNIKVLQAIPFSTVQLKAYLTPEILFHALFTYLEQYFKQFRSVVESWCIHLTDILDPDDDLAIRYYIGISNTYSI